MNGSPVVAAIVPTMDRPNKLKRALESVFNQTYDSIELIIVDGGNTDGAENVVSEYREVYNESHIKYLQNDEPKGLPAARNQAAEATEAELLAFLDDDDYWHSTKIARQVERLNPSDGEAMCYTGRISRTPEGKFVHRKKPTLEGDIFRDILVRNKIGSPSGVLVTHSAFDKVGQFDEELRYQEDWDFYLRMARKYNIACLAEPLVTRFTHSDAMSRDVEIQKKFREQILDHYEKELLRYDLLDTAWSLHYQDTGINFCLNGNTSRGRVEFRNALSKRRIKYLFILYFLSFLGPEAFNVARYIKILLQRFRAKFNYSEMAA